MGIRRACSYTASIKTQVNPTTYSAILVTIQQGGANLVTKTKTQLTVSSDEVTVKLTQAETALFAAGKKAFLQIRLYKSAYDAPGSKCWPLDVWPALDDRILP